MRNPVQVGLSKQEHAVKNKFKRMITQGSLEMTLANRLKLTAEGKEIGDKEAA